MASDGANVIYIKVPTFVCIHPYLWACSLLVVQRAMKCVHVGRRECVIDIVYISGSGRQSNCTT